MPTKTMVLNIIGVALQYAVLALLYYFLFQVLRAVYRDLKGPRTEERPKAPAAEPAAEATARLVVADAGAVTMSSPVYELGETVAIGRGEGNDIVIHDTFVSHEHALITRYKNGFWLTDLSSTNGTFHNNRRVTDEVALQSGDLIAVGAVTFRFER